MAPETTTQRRMPAAERRAALLDVAERLFVERGFSSVTIEDIAREAGITRPIVYRHFTALDGVYLACVQRARDDYAGELVQAIADAQGVHPREQLRLGADLFFRILERDPGRWRLLFGGGASLSGEYAEQLAGLRLGTIEAIGAALLQATVEAPPGRMEVTAHAVSGVGERLGFWWLDHPDVPREELVEHFVEITWAGVAPWAKA
ncbi:hypothetical protein ASD11_09530 [Aeromicrobium sp. Root495]|uniref:TetR/AcrR family transcriptional regulator n=1 Tax=Aeromicrobium sp. Root495 TaxID=1736550 RepID=UPI0006F80423|nr:TetR/AcrR family transcriptional regulator [Aeromicrobium sp. Root495]KQY59768.1 hypothetical protein ASD11_09530 [Aeromicrobium sp. Root495]